MEKTNISFEEQGLAEYLFHEGTNYKTYNYMGAHRNGDYCVFRVWAPNAVRVYVTGDFCDWEEHEHEAHKITNGGVFECVIEGVKEFDKYKYVILAKDGKERLKADPYAFHSETRPGTASKVYELDCYEWKDEKWMSERGECFDKPLNIYEVHLGSWKTYEDGEPFSYGKLAKELVPYVKKMGYTHVELMPVNEYPYDKSWGYQVTGYFAPTSRYGEPSDFMSLIDAFHKSGIGVILDWVPGHFPKDAFGLVEFDGTYCYEYSSKYLREHPEWGTRIFDYGKNEVKSFLLSSICIFLEKYHIDGVRVDAVASMLYLDYARKQGEWVPNKLGGRGNLEAVEFLKQFNDMVKDQYPGVMTIAEESTTWGKITYPTTEGGLGFSYKWNMGWMNDTLDYMETDPLFRKGVHNNLTFSLTYAFSEKYVLPLSHDEVVHGKKSLVSKIPTEYEDKFANLRAYIGYMYAHPGKKLMFMGGEFAQFIEWDESKGLDFLLLGYDAHTKYLEFSKILNKYYKRKAALWEQDDSWEGFNWVSNDDSSNNIYAFERINKKGKKVLVVSNFSSQKLKGYSIWVEKRGAYKEVLCTDSEEFGGDKKEKKVYKTGKKEGDKYLLKIDISPFSTTYYE